ncbi:MAG: hypothetical protein QOD07_2504 [Frankiaceae bacterium]|jgi:hypothetical protein|nr:hypothetical protein [Frankiaceae bacterium]
MTAKKRAAASQRTRPESGHGPGKTYYDVVREMSNDPELIKAAEAAEAAERDAKESTDAR